MTWRHEGSRHERGYGHQWVKLRGHILRRDDYLCQPCLRQGRPTQATQVDHIIPKAQDGTDDPENLQSICEPCHKAKTKAETSKRPVIGADGWPIW
jgi:5-methylcytosine-specific restriction protein A